MEYLLCPRYCINSESLQSTVTQISNNHSYIIIIHVITPTVSWKSLKCKAQKKLPLRQGHLGWDLSWGTVEGVQQGHGRRVIWAVWQHLQRPWGGKLERRSIAARRQNDEKVWHPWNQSINQGQTMQDLGVHGKVVDFHPIWAGTIENL